MPDIFRFKQFNVDQTGCAMKINTDGVLLGALSNTDNPLTIVDIGTGTGVIALMLAQRFANAHIDAIEIDKTAAHTAKLNFEDSAFADRLNIYSGSFESFFDQHPEKRYDLLVSNPPFHLNSLESPGVNKNLAKHTNEGFFEELIRYVAVHLTENGICCLILPLQTAGLVKTLIELHSLSLYKTINILSYPDSVPHREILMIGKGKTKVTDERFIIYKEPKVYSDEYINNLKSFFTIFK